MAKNNKRTIKKVLVTGGSGFIGSHVVDLLIQNGYAVRILDNLGAPTHDGTIPVWQNKKAEFLRGDVTKKEDWARALEGIDAVIHLAAYMDFHTNFSGYVKTNIESATLLFELINEKKLPIQKIVAASSQSVYGEGKYSCKKHGEFYAKPRTENNLKKHIWEQLCPKCGEIAKPVAEKEDDELVPLTPYGVSKLTSEHMLFALGREYNVPVSMLRFSIVLGERQSYRHFYSGALRSFCVNVLGGHPIQMNEDGGQLRDFVHVKDVAEAHLKVLEDDRANFQSYNVGLGKPTTVFDLAKMVAKAAKVKFNPSLSNRFRVGGSRHSVMNVDKLKKLGWKPKHKVEQAVASYLNWLKQFKDLDKILKETERKMEKDGILKKY